MRHRKHKTLRSLKDLSPNWKLPLPSGTQPVEVQSVGQTDAQTLQWTFTANVTSLSTGGGGMTFTVPQLQASGNGVTFQSPTAVTTVAGGLQAVYPSPVLSPGSIYSVTAPPVGVTFASGTLSVPQTGAVISSEEALELAEAAAPTSLKLSGTRARKTKSKKPTRRAA
jgi:hypothetical protein